MYSYAKRFSKTVHPPLNWNLKTWKVPSSKLFRRRRFFSTAENFASTGHPCTFKCFCQLRARTRAHNPRWITPTLSEASAHTFSKSQLTSPLYSESPSPRERNTVENLTNFSFRYFLYSYPLITWLISNRTISSVHSLSSSLSVFQTNWKRSLIRLKIRSIKHE